MNTEQIAELRAANSSAPAPATRDEPLELSIIMPCLNEAATVGTCVRKARGFLEENGIAGEIVIGDNGSTDGSQEIAEREGARVVHAPLRGYGAALQIGIASARGRYIIMGDSDDSYDFTDLMPFVEKLREGYELVMGNRFRGGIKPGAMPPLHRYLGNPVLSFIGRLFFRTPARDFHCGLRGFTMDAARRMGLRTLGMEFASEIVVKAALHGMRVTEVPTTLWPDGRDRPPHLRSWRDGWRHLRFLLLYSPKWLFFYPGAAMALIGLIIIAVLLPGPLVLAGVSFDVNTLLFAVAMILIGMQSIFFFGLAKAFSVFSGLAPKPLWFDRVFNSFNLETMLLIGAALIVLGFAMAIWAVVIWQHAGFGALDVGKSLRMSIPSILALSLGTSLIFNSFFLSLLGTPRR